MTAPAVTETAPAPRNAVAEAISNFKATPVVVAPVTEVAPAIDPNAPPEVDPNAPVEEVVETTEETVEEFVEKVVLPGRRPGEVDMEIEITDPVIADRLRQQQNGYERKSESLARLHHANQMIGEAKEFKASLQIDPIGVVTESLDIESQGLLFLRQLANPALWEKLGPTVIDVLSDETGQKLELLRAKLEVEARNLRDQRTEQIAEQRRVDQNTKAIEMSVDAIIPPNLSAEQRKLWRQDAFTELSNYAARTQVNFIHPQDVPHLLAARLRAHGSAPEHAAAAIQQAFTRPDRRPSGSPAASAPPTGEQFVQKARARLAASAAAPTGAGAPTAAAPTIPKNVGTKDAINAFRASRGIPQK